MQTLDIVELSPVRIVGTQPEPPVSRKARTWAEVQSRASLPPRVLASHKARRINHVRASYDAGIASRITAQWGVSSLNANRELRHTLTTLRARSRELERNDPYFKKFLDLVEINIVGAYGVSVQSRAGDYGPGPDYLFAQDRAANRIIEREYAAFSRAGQFDVTGKLSRAAFERLLIRAIARDGEVLVKIVADTTSRWGLRYQLLESDWLDETLNEDRADGTRIVMGVELDAGGKPIAYHLHKSHPGDTRRIGGHTRYLASQVHHYFRAERPEQVRGVPWGHAAMARLYQLGEFDQAAILAARLGADKFMVLEDAEGMAAELADGTMQPGDSSSPDINETTGALYYQSQKGSIDILPRGTKVADWDPNYPSDVYGQFVLAALRGVSTGFNVSYESLTNDRQGVTWTSIRHGVLDERESWKTLQDWLIEAWSWDHYTIWLDYSLIAPARPFVYLPPGKRDKFLAPSFHGRRWDWVNPIDDIQAKKEALALRLTSHRRVLAEQGMDLEEIIEEIAEDRALAAMHQVDLDAALTKQPTVQAAPPPGDPNEQVV